MNAAEWPGTLPEIAAMLRQDPGVLGKRDIALACRELGLVSTATGQPGDDCAALADGDGFLLFAMEGFIDAFVETDPWFAGWCGIMVNLSDILAMGGRPIAVTDAVWSADIEKAKLLFEGMRAASQAYGIPIVGGHTNLRAGGNRLAVAILGRARQLIGSFAARPGDTLIAAIDRRGEYRPFFNNWQTALDAPHDRLRGDMALLPMLAESGFCRAGKDISQGGLVGTAIMLAECSGVAIDILPERIEPPQGVPLARWLVTFPSFGFLLSVAPHDVEAVLAVFQAREIWAGAIGTVAAGSSVTLSSGLRSELIWDHAETPYLGLHEKERADA